MQGLFHLFLFCVHIRLNNVKVRHTVVHWSFNKSAGVWSDDIKACFRKFVSSNFFDGLRFHKNSAEVFTGEVMWENSRQITMYLRHCGVVNNQIKKGKIVEYLAKLQARAWLSHATCAPGQHTAKRRSIVHETITFKFFWYISINGPQMCRN